MEVYASNAHGANHANQPNQPNQAIQAIEANGDSYAKVHADEAHVTHEDTNDTGENDMQFGESQFAGPESLYLEVPLPLYIHMTPTYTLFKSTSSI
jgi:hypothetical protein